MAYKIIIAGGTGFLGHSLIEYFRKIEGTSIVIFTRGQSRVQDKISYLQWDAQTVGKWKEALEGSTAVINLVGKSVNCRYTRKNKKEIIRSRVNATHVIGQAIQQLANPPKVWINAGSAAIFGDGGDKIKDEHSYPGDGFSAFVCKKWEAAFNEAHAPSTRKVFLRAGLVFQKDRGLLRPFYNLVRAGFGGRIGSGKQYISWIHENDFVNVVHAVLKNEHLRGIVHCTSPWPVTNHHFMSVLRTILKRSWGIVNPAILVKAGAPFIGTEAELVLTGRRVVSKILEEEQFIFEYPHIEEALQHLLKKV